MGTREAGAFAQIILTATSDLSATGRGSKVLNDGYPMRVLGKGVDQFEEHKME